MTLPSYDVRISIAWSPDIGESSERADMMLLIVYFEYMCKQERWKLKVIFLAATCLEALRGRLD